MLKANPGMSAYRACKLVGLHESVLSRALSEQKRKEERRKFLEQGGYFVAH
jgi:hypothetical protein